MLCESLVFYWSPTGSFVFETYQESLTLLHPTRLGSRAPLSE